MDSTLWTNANTLLLATHFIPAKSDPVTVIATQCGVNKVK